MAQGLSLRVKAEPCRTVLFGDIAAGYSIIGTPMAHPVRAYLLQNWTDTPVWISFNGVDNNLPMLSLASFIFDITANRTLPEGFYLAQGDRVYCKRHTGVPASGAVYLTVWYGE